MTGFPRLKMISRSIIHMSTFKWVLLFALMWSGVFLALVVSFLIAFLYPDSCRYGYIENSTVWDLLWVFANIYFPYIGMSLAGFISYRSRRTAIPARLSGFAWMVAFLSAGFNLVVIVVSVIFVMDSESNPESITDFLPLMATIFSLFMSGFLAYLYAKL